jgi:hypothetical protein
MAIKIQHRRGTAAQWDSADPVLDAGEIGFETDTGKFKIGDNVTEWTELPYAAVTSDELESSVGDYIPLADIDEPGGVPSLDSNSNLYVAGSSIIIEGATENDFETTLTVTDPTEDRTITFPNASGTVALTSDLDNLDSLPSQEGNAGKYLTTDGTVASWGTVTAGGSASDDTIFKAQLFFGGSN